MRINRTNLSESPSTGPLILLSLEFSGMGLELLRSLAQSTGALVEAAINAQYDDPLYTYEGPTVVVGRGGSFASSQ